MSAITVTNLSKAYKHYPSLGARLMGWVFGGFHTLNWVLRDINFAVNPGEAVGIVGMNGMGKSTLLKMIAGTSKATSGEIVTQGRISALLELGVWFHPEFTGRHNAFITGQLMGQSNQIMQKLMPAIEAFAEIGCHMDKPIRVYSTGMKMRLAFAVATITNPEILIIDEALSVGDGYFQHKCFRRLQELRRQGSALLFVSHDSNVLTALCDRALLLHQGAMVMQGTPELVLNKYRAILADVNPPNTAHAVFGNGEASVIGIALFDGDHKASSIIHVGDEVRLCIRVKAHADLSELTLGYEIKDVYGRAIFGTNTKHLHQQLTNVSKGDVFEFNIHFTANIGPGFYGISIALHTSYDHLEKTYEWRDLALTFSVANVDKPTFLGAAWLPPLMECKTLSPCSEDLCFSRPLIPLHNQPA